MSEKAITAVTVKLAITVPTMYVRAATDAIAVLLSVRNAESTVITVMKISVADVISVRTAVKEMAGATTATTAVNV